MRKVVIRAFPRVHITLVDMGRATARTYGGLGFSYRGQETVWQVEAAPSFSIVGLDKLDEEAKHQIHELASVIPGVTSSPIRFELVSTARQHCGYGTKTTLLLSFLAGVREINSLSLGDADLVKLSRRGGASGIGVHAFFLGGVVWDGGHASERVEQLLPSSARSAAAVPPLLARWDFPDSWRVFDLGPAGSGLAGEAETDFFLSNTPIARLEALETIASVVHGAIPAMATCDLALLRRSLNELSRTGFKKREIAARGEDVQNTLSELADIEGIAAGMSSTGPMLYVVVTDGDEQVVCAVREVAARHRLCVRGPYSPCNHGFEIERLS